MWFDFELGDRIEELANGTAADSDECAVPIELSRAAVDINIGI
jgi:hypothetical protein